MAITAVRMPKWGLSMQEGAITDWSKPVGATVEAGEELIEIETAKIANVAEAPGSGVLRRIIAQPGETAAVGALLGVIADADTPESEIDAFVEAFQSAPPDAEDGEGEGAVELQTIDAGDRTLRIARSGAGGERPVVLLHGFASDLNSWLFNTAELAAKREVVAVDLPGHGGSSKDVGDGSLKTLAETILKGLDGIGVQRFDLVAHSLGAAVAVRLAADHPDRVGRLVLIAPPFLSGKPVAKDFLDGIVDSDRARALKPWLEQLVDDPQAITRDMVEDVVRFKRVDGVEEALSALRDRLVSDADAEGVRAAVKALPGGLVIASRGDRIVGFPQAEALGAGWRLAPIEGSSHIPHLEKFSEVNSEIARGLDG